MSLDNKIVRESFRATEEEDNTLQKDATSLNMRKSEYIRFMLFENNKKSTGDVFAKLQELKEKYIVMKHDSKDITKSHMLNMEIQAINKIINNIDKLEKGEELEV